MNRILIFTIFLFSEFCFSQIPSSEITLDDLPEKQTKEASFSASSVSKNSQSASSEKRRHSFLKKPFREASKESSLKKDSNFSKHEVPQSNLPPYAKRKAVSEFLNPVQYAKGSDYKSNSALRMGDIFRAVIPHSITAYTDSVAPVTAKILSGIYKGALLFGTASMDRITKRINISFFSMRESLKTTPNEILAIAQAEDGRLGVNGVFESQYWNYFWAETLANTVSAAADVTTSKAQNQWGSFVPQPGVDSALKQGVASAMSKTADRLAERSRTLPETSTAEGPILINVVLIK